MGKFTPNPKDCLVKLDIMDNLQRNPYCPYWIRDNLPIIQNIYEDRKLSLNYQA